MSRYTANEIFEIFVEQHRLTSPLDASADMLATIKKEMTVSEWRDANDLIDIIPLSKYLNEEFQIKVDVQEWIEVLEPSQQKTLINVCKLIAENAQKSNFEPKLIFGKNSIEAGIFLGIKDNLKERGVDVSYLKPSSNIGDYIISDFDAVLQEITFLGKDLIPEIKVERNKSGVWNFINIFDKNRYSITTGEIKRLEI